MVRELPIVLELVRHGGILIPGRARGGGTGTRRAPGRHRPARRVTDPRPRAGGLARRPSGRAGCCRSGHPAAGVIARSGTGLTPYRFSVPSRQASIVLRRACLALFGSFSTLSSRLMKRRSLKEPFSSDGLRPRISSEEVLKIPASVATVVPGTRTVPRSYSETSDW